MTHAGSAALSQNHNIQALRAIAALGVVLHHMVDALHHHLAPGRTSGWEPAIGSYGVDLFFVISGYVMMMVVARRPVTPGQFLRDRVFRIVPLYWLLTVAACIPLLLGLRIFGNDGFTLGHLARSLFFVPPLGAGDPEWPILFVGWTLNFEMMFYLLFALALAWVRPQWRAPVLAGGIGALAGIAAATGWAWLQFIGNPIILGFALGVVLWEFSARFTLRPRTAGLLIVLGLATMIGLDIAGVAGLERTRGLVALPAALIVAGAIALERSRRSVGAGALSHLGDASYALYLSHPFVLQVVGKAAVVSGLNLSAWGLAMALAAMFIGSIAIAMAMHRYVERPMLAATKAWSTRRSAAVQACAA